MSRPAATRNLTLTEELEKLEQSITLTLQEIDSNFSKAHRIVTSSILPLVEQYGEHSKNVWEASKFWKQFFEASANVSLSGYEELANDENATGAIGNDDTTRIEDTTALEDYTQEEHGEDDVTADQSAYAEQSQHRDVEDSLLDDGSLAGSTPRPPATKSMKTMQFADMDNSYENLRRELKNEADGAGRHGFPPEADEDEEDETVELPDMVTQTKLPDMSMNMGSSIMLEAPSPNKGGNKDPLLHRMLDKNYRIQATPHKLTPAKLTPAKLTAGKAAAGGLQDMDATRRALWQDSPMSSPEIAAPTLRTNLYSAASPLKRRGLARGLGDGPRTPGVSVQTPGAVSKTRDVFADEKGKRKRDPDDIDWSDDDETDEMFKGMSPPKTIQFALPPSKLMQTPAREASKRIVDDILLTAGAAPQYLEEGDEYSPTMVKMNKDILDDSF